LGGVKKPVGHIEDVDVPLDDDVAREFAVVKPVAEARLFGSHAVGLVILLIRLGVIVDLGEDGLADSS